jgi:two-component system cell cycle response regulator
MTTKPDNAASGARVMVVDDSAGIRRLLSTRLRHAGYEVVEAASGRDALRAYQREPSEVVITDVSMPGLGGLELLAELRAAVGPPEVILLTGVRSDDAQAAVQALRLGAHDYITKAPAALEAVVLAVERALEKWRLREQNERLVRELRSLSLTDDLTGLGNRRAFDEALRREVARARRFDQPLSLALLDLDHFKQVNDTLGHDAGDSVLVSFAGRLRTVARLSDAIFRYGGEEFVVILFGTPLGGGVRFAERLRAATMVQSLAAGGHRVAVTVSVGVAELAVADDDSGLTLFTRADAALYKAKRAGRNRVMAEEEVAIALPGPLLTAAGLQRRPAC